MTGNIGLAGLWKDLYVVYFMAVTEALHDGYEENHENIQTR
jgi:hypothetical protein